MDEGRVIAGVGRHEKMKDGEMSILFVYMLGWGGCIHNVWGQAAEWGRTFRLTNSRK